MSAGYDFAWFDNTGFKSVDIIPPGGLEEDTETGEGDYQADNYSISMQYSFNLGKYKTRLKGGLALEQRFYQTARSPLEDAIHSGRRDYVYNTDLTYTVDLSKRIQIELGAAHNRRFSRGLSPLVAQVKDYSRFETWTALSCDLW